VEPKDVIHACAINKYSLLICDDRFYHEYIQRNFKPQFYGLESFTLPLNSNWKSYLNILVNGITLPAEILVKFDKSNILEAKVNVHFKDTLQDICDNVKNSMCDKHLNMELNHITLIGTAGDEKLALRIYPDSDASLNILKDPRDTIGWYLWTERTIIDTIFKTNPITKINNNESFYLNLEKIWVCIGYKRQAEY
jgi:hypothetical protein